MGGGANTVIYSLSFPFLLSYLLHLPFLSSLPLLTSRPPYLPTFFPSYSLSPPVLPIFLTFFPSYSLSPPILPIFLTFSANAHPFVAWHIVLLLSLPNQHPPPPSFPFYSLALLPCPFFPPQNFLYLSTLSSPQLS